MCQIHRNGNEEAVQLLLRRPDIDVNTQSCGGRPMGILGANLGENALIESVVYRRHTIAKTLVLRGDTLLDVVDERDRTPLIMATQYGSVALKKHYLYIFIEYFHIIYIQYQSRLIY